MSSGEFSISADPIAGFRNLFQTFQKARCAYGETIDGFAVLSNKVDAADLDGIYTECCGSLVKLYLKGETGLNGAVPSFGPACGFVCIVSRRMKAVALEAVWRGEELSTVVRGDQTKRRVCTTV